MFLSSRLSVFAQQNYVVIGPSDSEKDIVAKAAKVTPTPEQLRWQRLELTAFFHFGMNTFTNKEWGDGTEDEKLFNPTALDARQWVSVCKRAGIKQVILTAKHHDGFCLWPSKYTEHSVKNSPWKDGKGDVVREVSNACKEMGVGFGVYLSPWDRNNKAYGTEGYNDYFVNQLTELLTNYGKVDEVWFDGANGEGPNGKKQVYDFARWYKVIRKLQPKAVIAIMGPDVRWVGTESGYGREQEWSVVPFDASSTKATATADGSQTSVDVKPVGDLTGDVLGSREKILKANALGWYPAETDVSIRPGWFYHSNEDKEVKTPEKLMDIYFNSVGKNSVLLLNIPPDRRGLLSDADVKSLLGWKELRDKLFSVNLAGKVGVMRRAEQGAGDKAGQEYVLPLDLPKTSTFDVCSLQEDISKGQRVESYVLEGFQNGEWKKITEGTTIGYKRLLKFDPYTGSKVRLRILSSRLEPAIAEAGLYREPGSDAPGAGQAADAQRAGQAASKGKWINLFNGKDLKDWTVKIKGYPAGENFANTFRVENGVMKVNYDGYDGLFKARYGHIFYKKKFSAYLVVVEYRFTGDQMKDGADWAYRNSGVMLAGQTPESMELNQDFPISLEEQLLGGNGKDDRPTANLCTPGTNVVLYDSLFTPHCVNSTAKTYHGDQWVHVEALVLGDSILRHIVGNDTVLTYTKPQYDGRDEYVRRAGLPDGGLIPEGTISLQSESHPCEFRKAVLFDLGPYMNDPVKLREVIARLQKRKENKF